MTLLTYSCHGELEEQIYVLNHVEDLSQTKRVHISSLEAGLNDQALLLYSWHGPDPSVFSYRH